MTGVSDERWEQQNRRTRDVAEARARADWLDSEYAQLCGEVYGQELDGYATAGDRGWHPDTRFASSAVFCLTIGGIVACGFIGAVVEAVRFLVWAWNVTG